MPRAWTAVRITALAGNGRGDKTLPKCGGATPNATKIWQLELANHTEAPPAERSHT